MFFSIKIISGTNEQKISKKKFSSHIAHFQHTNRLNNRLIDYSVSRLFNNQLVASRYLSIFLFSYRYLSMIFPSLAWTNPSVVGTSKRGNKRDCGLTKKLKMNFNCLQFLYNLIVFKNHNKNFF